MSQSLLDIRGRCRRGLTYSWKRRNVMNAQSDAITITLPKSIVREVPLLSDLLQDRMHELLERNTDGLLSATEREELETLVHMAQFAQILEMALQPANHD